MDIPTPPRAVAALAAFLRDRLGDVTGALHPALSPTLRRQLATVVVGAAAPFAPTSYSRARLVRQMYASGLLSDEQARATQAALDGTAADTPVDPLGAPVPPR